MTREQQIQVLRKYAEKFQRWSRERCPGDFDRAPGMGRAVKHANWMAHEMLERIEEGEASEGKVNRWLGFIQGVLWSAGLFTIDEMREHNIEPTEGNT